MKYSGFIQESVDLPGCYVASCPPLGLVTQGTSLTHAARMMIEAITMVVDDDIKAGRSTYSRFDMSMNPVEGLPVDEVVWTVKDDFIGCDVTNQSALLVLVAEVIRGKA